jgi:serine/threonine protein kinase
MSEINIDQTDVYDSSEESKTDIYDDGLASTSVYSDANGNGFKSKTHGIELGQKITLHEKEYTITEIISEETGEAVIYKIEDEKQKIFALKLYLEFANSKEEPNEVALERIKKIADPDILRLHDFGVGANKYREKYCFEISDYAKGGDLFSVADIKAKYTPQFVEKTIIPEIFKGIKKLHESKIYHCDLKPGNVFFSDAKQTDIVIGDYGSAKTYDLETLNELRKTTVVKGTQTYLAPEQRQGIISEKNDYYSFGIILLHLLYPESIAAEGDFKTIQKEKFDKIVERQYTNKPIIDFKSEYKRLNDLIEGLTLISYPSRWGKTEVEKWLRGEKVEVRSDAGSVLPIKLGIVTIRTDAELIDFIETNPEWHYDLIKDADTYKTVKNWLDSYRDIPTRKTFDSMVEFYKPLGMEYVKEAIIRFFKPARPIKIDFDLFDIYNSENVAEEVETFIGKIDDIWKHSKFNTAEHLEKLRLYLFQLEFALRQRNEALGGIFYALGISEKSFADFKTEIQEKFIPNDESAAFHLLVDLFYKFDSGRSFKDLNNKSIETLEDLGLFYAADEAAFTDKFLVVEKEKFLAKLGKSQLDSLDYNSFIFEIFKNKAENQIELTGLSMDTSRLYKINYKYFKSLDKFLSKHNINREFTSRSGSSERYEQKRKFMQSFEPVCEDFIQAVCKKHNISKLSNENLSQIREKFKRDSWERYIYLRTNLFLPKTPAAKKTLKGLKDEKAKTEKAFHWREGLWISFLSILITGSLLGWLAYSMGWIQVGRSARYITFTKPVKLDGVSFEKDDFLEITNENEFNVCAKNGSGEKCYPTAATAAIYSRQGNVLVDKLGKLDFELSYARDVFKVTKAAKLGNRSFQPGSIVDLTENSNERFCFDVPGKDKCFSRRSTCRSGNCNNMIDEYGSAISNYRGKRLFTFNQNGTLEGLSVQKGMAFEVTKETPWSNCVSTTNGQKCFLTETAVNRLKQPDVPVLQNFGTIGYRESTMTGFGLGVNIFFILSIAGLVFWGATKLIKQMRLFVLRGEINTLEFKS